MPRNNRLPKDQEKDVGQAIKRATDARMAGKEPDPTDIDKIKNADEKLTEE